MFLLNFIINIVVLYIEHKNDFQRAYEGALETSTLVYGPVIPPPHQLEVLQEQNGTYVLFWKNPGFAAEKLSQLII